MTVTYRRRFVPLLLAVLFALAFFVAPSARAADAIITGQVVGKNGASGIAGTSIALEIATAAGGVPQTRSTTARDDGTFRFDGFTFDPNAVYLVKVTYDGGIYFREVTFASGATSADVGAIEVYPGTRDAGTLSFPRLNTIFSSFDQDNTAQAIETGAYSNSSDHAFVGLPQAQNAMTVRFGLPQSAIGIQPAQGLNRDTMVSLDEPPLAGFATIEAVPPGDQEFAYIYRVQTHGDTLDFDRVFPYTTGLYSLYLPPKARLVSGGSNIGLRDSGEQTLQNGQVFRVFTANNIPANSRLVAHFSGLPTAGSEINPLIPAMLVFVLLIGIGLIVVYGRNRRPSMVTAAATRQVKTVPGNVAKVRANGSAKPVKNGSKPSEDTPAESLAARKERLLLELVELDDRYEAGDLEEADYRRLRRVRKNDLVVTLRKLGTPDDAAEPDASELSPRAGRRRS
jgi:hypothetical protein